METRRWTNPSQPQTLQIAVFLLYANAVFGLVFRSPFLLFGVALGFLIIVGYAARGFGVANDQNWGYGLALAVSAVVIVATVVRGLGPANLLSLMFDIALLVLLLHPQSRSYQKIWFK